MPKLRLDSWKSIAEYLHRSPRTVQRWHAEHGLPVHHFGGGKGTVFAYTREIDTWLSGFAEGNSAEQAGTDKALEARKTQSCELTAIADEMLELCSEDNLSIISGLYRKAIDQDPGYAPAFTGLANSIVLAALAGILRGSAAYPRAAEAVRRALQLDPESVEARCAAAWLQTVHERKWKPARDGFEEVLRKQPLSSHALSGRALLHVAEGNFTEATRCLQDAWKQNPLASTVNALLCWTQYLSGDCDSAMSTAAQARASGECMTLNAAVEAFAAIQAGPIDSILPRLERVAGDEPRSLLLQGALGYAQATANQAGKAWETFYNLKRSQGDCSYPLALILIGLDEQEQAILCLETSFAEGSLWSLGFRFDPFLRPLHERDRYEPLLRKLRFPS